MKRILPMIISLLVGVIMSACDVREETKQPIACFTASSYQIGVGELVSFSADCSTDAASLQWDFGNNNTSVAANPSYRFDDVGEHVVKLIVVNRNLMDETTRIITVVSESEPIAGFSYSPLEPLVNEQIKFTNTSVDAENYSWDFGDGASSEEKDPNHIYTESGSYRVGLTAYKGTISNQIFKQIVVSVQPDDSVASLIADFTFLPVTPLTYEYVYFTNISENAESYYWTFGDGTDSYDESPTHYYTVSGEYDVTLIAYNGDDSESVLYKVNIYDELAEFDPTVYDNEPVGGWDAYYVDDFDEDVGDWSIKDEGGVSASISDGYYNIALSGTEGSWYFWSTGAELPESVYDYDIDVYLQVMRDDSTYGSGLVWGMETSELDANDFKLTNYENELWYTVGDPNYYWLSTATGWDNLYGLYLSENLLSVRKYGSKFYVFLNKILIIEHDYQVFGNSFGFYVGKESEVQIDVIGIHTMNHGTKKAGKTKNFSNSHNIGNGYGVAKSLNPYLIKRLK